MIGLLLVVAVLTYLIIAVVITWRQVRSRKTLSDKITTFLVCTFIFALIPTWDIPLIEKRFQHLCKTEAGIHVYEQAVLGDEYWNEDGTLKLPFKARYDKIAPTGFETVLVKGDRILRKKGLYKAKTQIRRKSDQKILGERIAFTRLGNWPLRIIGFDSWIPIEDYSNVCPHPMKIPYSDLYKSVFKQKLKNVN